MCGHAISSATENDHTMLKIQFSCAAAQRVCNAGVDAESAWDVWLLIPLGCGMPFALQRKVCCVPMH